MVNDIRDVLVVGGGISGLTTAWYLRYAGIDVSLVDAADGIGGVTRTERRDGFLLEKGPFNVIVRDPAFETLLEGLSDDIQVVSADKAAKTRYLYKNGRLSAVPTNPIALATTPLLGAGGKLKLVKGMFLGRRSDGTEETIEQVGIRRFGRQVTDTMISAVIAGIFAGDIRKLSLKSCFPTVAKVDREARCLIAYGFKAGMRAKKERKRKEQEEGGTPVRRWKGLVSLDAGLGSLTQALAASLGNDCVSGCRASEIVETDYGYEVQCETRDGGDQVFRCRRLVLATPIDDAARLLQPLVPDAAAIMETVDSAPMVVVNVGFKREHVGHPLEGFGFLVPHNETTTPVLGILWADSIFPHHAPDGHRLLRVFIGGSRTPHAHELSDDELLARANDGLRDLLQVSGDPVLVDICRWPVAIPQYHVGHRDKMDRLKAVIAGQPNLDLIGNYIEGVSLNDCVRCATNTADEIIRQLGSYETADTRAMAAAS